MKCFEEDLEYSLKLEKNIVHDQTNLSRKKRKSIIDRIPNDYYKLCIALTCTEEDWQKRLANRPGKVIPVNILKSMGERLEHVWNDEGFDDVIYRNTSGF
jgi:gluconate kinase